LIYLPDQWTRNLARTLLPIFEVEARNNVDVIHERLLRLETADASDSAQLLDDISRSAHRLKGASGAVDLPEIAEIADRLELLFQALKTTKDDLRPELVDVIHEALDAITLLTREATGGRLAQIDIAGLSARLAAAQAAIH
jgi:two-component system chemotaxis sensor kinase CheA